jgi:hypothetical protein
MSEALRELVFDTSSDVGQVVDRYFAEDFRHRNSGRSRTRDEFVRMAAQGREYDAGGPAQSG